MRSFSLQALLAMLMLSVLSFANPSNAQVMHLPQKTVSPDQIWFQLGVPDDPFADLLVQAQSCGSDCKDYEEPGKGKSKSRYGTNLNKGTTNNLVRILKDANDTCDERILKRYRIDCLRIYYGWVADELPESGEYLPIKQAMRKAEKKLSAIVSANVDKTQPVITPREGHKKNAKKMPPLRAVKPAAEKKAIAQAEAVVKETELVILRSGEDPARRAEHFQEVAAAVDSNLVILRSA